jgi:hypothetical protein
VQLIDENRWEAVLITENKADVEGMYEYGLVSLFQVLMPEI